MAQLTLLALLAVAGWLAWRRFGPRPAPRFRRPAAPLREVPQPIRLELDPKTGVYRPVQRRDR